MPFAKTVLNRQRSKRLAKADSLSNDATGWSPAQYSIAWEGAEWAFVDADHGTKSIGLMTTPVLTTDGVIGGGNAISTNSKYVERSVYFMQWINLNVKARNIFAYGIEGTHWNMNPEGNVTRTEAGTTNYLPAAWPQGTFFTQYVEARTRQTTGKAYSRPA